MESDAVVAIKCRALHEYGVFISSLSSLSLPNVIFTRGIVSPDPDLTTSKPIYGILHTSLAELVRRCNEL